eukprot:scaffold62806_cov74-Cyclotella_meneghiniana.AAC.3
MLIFLRNVKKCILNAKGGVKDETRQDTILAGRWLLLSEHQAMAMKREGCASILPEAEELHCPLFLASANVTRIEQDRLDGINKSV